MRGKMRLSAKIISQQLGRVQYGLRQGLMRLKNKVKERAAGLKIRKRTGKRVVRHASDSQLEKRILKALERQTRGLTFQELLHCLGTEKSVLQQNIEKLMGEDEVVNTRRLYFLKKHKTAEYRVEGR